MLRSRNTYKNCKIMLLYAFLSIFFLVLAAVALLACFLPEYRVVGIVVCAVSSIIFIVNFFLLIMKNNDYKLKNFFKLGSFYKEFKKFEKISKGNKRTIKQIKKDQKDYFLQTGEIWLYSETDVQVENNKWNDWIATSSDFSYQNAHYMEKLSYLTYVLYNACASGGGLEEFLRWVSYDSFTNKELIDVITKNDFFEKEFKSFMVSIINEYDKEKQDELFERYEIIDNKKFFTFENDLYDCGSWLANNRVLLSSCVGIYLNNLKFNIHRLYLSKDYRSVIFIYSKDDKQFKVAEKIWDAYDCHWDDMRMENAIYDSEKSAIDHIKDKVQEYIELDI